MGLKNLGRINYFNEPTTNPNFFIPLTVKLDKKEKAQFFLYFNTFLKPDIGLKSLYVPMPDASKMFPKTIKKTNKFLEPLGLAVRNLTVFVGGPLTGGRSIHVDGIQGPDGNDSILEARLSYYEMAEAPGVIRWFPKTEEYTKFVSTEPGIYATQWMPPWVEDLKSGKLTWETCPDFEFETTSNTPSALIRTNMPHYVLQGLGVRLTISAQLVWAETRSTVGVWDHIQQNFHLLGI